MEEEREGNAVTFLVDCYHDEQEHATVAQSECSVDYDLVAMTVSPSGVVHISRRDASTEAIAFLRTPIVVDNRVVNLLVVTRRRPVAPRADIVIRMYMRVHPERDTMMLTQGTVIAVCKYPAVTRSRHVIG